MLQVKLMIGCDARHTQALICVNAIINLRQSDHSSRQPSQPAHVAAYATELFDRLRVGVSKSADNFAKGWIASTQSLSRIRCLAVRTARTILMQKGQR